MNRAENRRLSWDEIRKIHPLLPNESFGWHVHTSGGGWVQGTTKIGADCFVANTAIVKGYAQLSNRARVLDQSVVSGNSIVGGFAQILDKACICGRAVVRGRVKICDDSRVCDVARLGGCVELIGSAVVGGDVQLFDWERIVDRELYSMEDV